MTAFTLTNEQARNFLLSKHGLLGEYKFSGKEGVYDYVKQVGCVQFDPVDACGKNAELVLQSRIDGFTKDMLYQLLYTDRKLIDYFDKNMSICCVEDWKYFSRIRNHYQSNGRSRDKIDPIAVELKHILKEKRFACSKDLEMSSTVDWYWSKTSLARAALETLYFRGDLIIHHKKGSIKYYALAEDYISPDILQASDPNSTDEAYMQWHILRRIGAVGMLWNKPSDAWLGIGGMNQKVRQQAFASLIEADKLIECEVEGIPHKLYVLREDETLLENAIQTGYWANRIEFLAPLDNLIWDRRLIRAIFGFDYKWEIYTPVDQRKYGYYVLPVLWGNRFIGRIEFNINKKAKKLGVLNFWAENRVEINPTLKSVLNERVRKFARFNDCEFLESAG